MNEMSIHKKPFRVFDFDLPLLAVKAAIELDMIMAKMETDAKSLNELAQLLKNSWIDLSGTAKESYLDPASISVLDQAMNEAGYGEKRVSVDELTEKALELADKLVDTNKTRNGELQKLHRFCLALSDLATSYRLQVFDEDPHPMRA